jgi:peptidoglycan/LPS O-acetylase OafA/YrhL
MTAVDNQNHVGSVVSSHLRRSIKFAICMALFGAAILLVAAYCSTQMTIIAYESFAILAGTVALMLIFKPLKK